MAPRRRGTIRLNNEKRLNEEVIVNMFQQNVEEDTQEPDMPPQPTKGYSRRRSMTAPALANRRLSSRRTSLRSAVSTIQGLRRVQSSSDESAQSFADIVSSISAVNKLSNLETLVERWSEDSKGTEGLEKDPSAREEKDKVEAELAGLPDQEDEMEDGLVTTAIRIETLEQLHEHINERKDELDKTHLDEVEQLDKILTKEMDDFKKMCTNELASLTPDNEHDHQQIERKLMVHKMRMQRLKEHQLNAKNEVDKRHSREKKKVEAIITKRLSQYENTEKSQVDERMKALAKLLGFLNGPTFNKMLEEHPIIYEPLKFQSRIQQVTKQAYAGVSAFMNSVGSPRKRGSFGHFEDDEASEEAQSLVVEEHQICSITDEAVGTTVDEKHVEDSGAKEIFLGDHWSQQNDSTPQVLPGKVDICWFSSPIDQRRNGGIPPMKTISLPDCSFNIVPPDTRKSN